MSSDDSSITKRIKCNIVSHVDFPKKGVVFRDIFPLMRNAVVFKECIGLMCKHVRQVAPDVEVIVGLDARGFIFGSLVAQELSVVFVPVRKKGKLPGATISAEYSLEYGKDSVEIQKDSVKAGQKVVIVDDLIATGGTMKAAVDLMQEVRAEICECLVVIELVDLHGKDSLGVPFHSLVQYDDSDS